MESVIAVVGSGRKHGVTCRATRQFLDDLQSLGDAAASRIQDGPRKRAAGVAFDRIAARSSKARDHHRAGAPSSPDP